MSNMILPSPGLALGSAGIEGAEGAMAFSVRCKYHGTGLSIFRYIPIGKSFSAIVARLYRMVLTYPVINRYRSARETQDLAITQDLIMLAVRAERLEHDLGCHITG